MKLSIILYFFFISLTVTGQFSISGVAENNQLEKLTGATVYLEGTPYATTTDVKGYYLLDSIPPGIYTIAVSYLGYTTIRKILHVKDRNLVESFRMEGSIYGLDQIEIISNRVRSEASFTHTNIPQQQLRIWNTGQDMPYLLRMTPSAVVTSDAGAGIGYTGIRIRGTDASRINVTINGIPVNDAESQGVFWVNMPDISSSTSNIQIQRGVGASTQGPGAFGGTVSINTLQTFVNPYARISSGIGSFNTFRITAEAGTGLIDNKYSIDARYSRIHSDGYIDRAFSELQSMYFSAARVTDKSSTRLIAFTGHEITYQSWFGTPQSKVEGDEEALLNHYVNNKGTLYQTPGDSVNLFSSDRKYNYYQYGNQVDNYRQTHIQLHDFRKLNRHLVLNSSMNYTKGRGFFEELALFQELSRYGLEGEDADVIRRRWLDNDYYGGNLNIHYQKTGSFSLSSGVSAFRYIGDHFGRVVDVPDRATLIDRTNNYYFSQGNKNDLSAFSRGEYEISNRWSVTGDIQWRNVQYSASGNDNDLREHAIEVNYHFFNPKAGILHRFNNEFSAYSSFAIAQKEPNRTDFVDNPAGTNPQPEKLYNLEMGMRKEKGKITGELVLYNMQYTDQLVLTGALNDVGSPLRANVPSSYRRGMELSINTEVLSNLKMGWQSTVSRNKINRFEEVLYNYTDGFEIVTIQHEKTDISFSPRILHTVSAEYRPSDHFQFLLLHQYIGRQYLDNTGNRERSLKAYHVTDLLLEFNPRVKWAKNMSIRGECRNVLNNYYSSNGYSYSYIFGEVITENFLYPQAGRNFMVTLAFGF